MREKLLTEAQLLVLLLNRKNRTALRPFAQELGVNFRQLARVINGEDTPGLAIPAALGYEPVVFYRKLKTKTK